MAPHSGGKPPRYQSNLPNHFSLQWLRRSGIASWALRMGGTGGAAAGRGAVWKKEAGREHFPSAARWRMIGPGPQVRPADSRANQEVPNGFLSHALQLHA